MARAGMVPAEMTRVVAWAETDLEETVQAVAPVETVRKNNKTSSPSTGRGAILLTLIHRRPRLLLHLRGYYLHGILCRSQR